MDDAIAVLQAAVDRSDEGPQIGADVRLALKALRFAGTPPSALRYFWASCQADSAARSQSMRAALNRIEMIRSGRMYSDGAPTSS